MKNPTILFAGNNEVEKVFSAMYEAENYLKDVGFTVGIMCRDEPIGFAPADQYGYISKWYNMTSLDKSKLTGIITSEDFRDGDVRIEFFTK